MKSKESFLKWAEFILTIARPDEDIPWQVIYLSAPDNLTQGDKRRAEILSTQFGWV
mgnify:CR=1 FL=1